MGDSCKFDDFIVSPFLLWNDNISVARELTPTLTFQNNIPFIIENTICSLPLLIEYTDSDLPVNTITTDSSLTFPADADIGPTYSLKVKATRDIDNLSEKRKVLSSPKESQPGIPFSFFSIYTAEYLKLDVQLTESVSLTFQVAQTVIPAPGEAANPGPDQMFELNFADVIVRSVFMKDVSAFS